MTSSVSLISEISANEVNPWILGQPYPEKTFLNWVIVVPESHLVRLNVDVPTSLLKHPEAMLYAVENKLPSIEGRGALVMHAKPASVIGHSTVQLLIYPKAILEAAVVLAKTHHARVMGAMMASEWWGIALPSETAMWVDDALEAWVKLPSQEVYSVNRCVPSALQAGLWVSECSEPIKGVVCYGAQPSVIELSIQACAWPESIRWRVLPLAALHEAPCDHSLCWDLLTHRRWSTLSKSKNVTDSFFAGIVKLGVVVALCVLGALVFPWIHNGYFQAQQHAALNKAWASQHAGGGDIPRNIERAWNERIGRLPLPEGAWIPHMDPLGLWIHINRSAIWLSLPPLSDVRYEGQRWWLSWPSNLSAEQLGRLTQSLLASGWRVDVSEEGGKTRVVIASAWTE